jgi:hypothetical protein
LKEETGFISGKSGFSLEKKAFKLIFKMNKIAILNDLTSCILHSDITIVEKDKPAIFIECKKGKRTSRRLQNQINSINDVLKFQNEGKREFEGKEVLGVHFNNIELNHTDLLKNLINKGIEEGYSSYTPENGLYYFVIKNVSNVNRLQSALDSLQEPSLIFLSHNTFIAGYTPMPLLIKDPDLSYKYYSEEFVLLVCVDEYIVKSKYGSKGYKVELLKNDEKHRYKIFHSNEEDTFILISNYLFFRVIYEFISLDWFINETFTMFENLDSM